MNQSWPSPEVARRLRDRRDGIDVRVRVVLSRDGDVWLDGRTTRWHGEQVCVLHSDPHSRVPYVCVDAADVERRR